MRYEKKMELKGDAGEARSGWLTLEAELGGAIWLVTGPAMATLLKARTVKALDVLAQNAVTMASHR